MEDKELYLMFNQMEMWKSMKKRWKIKKTLQVRQQKQIEPAHSQKAVFQKKVLDD
jgi:hypothetical protein